MPRQADGEKLGIEFRCPLSDILDGSILLRPETLPLIKQEDGYLRNSNDLIGLRAEAGHKTKLAASFDMLWIDQRVSLVDDRDEIFTVIRTTAELRAQIPYDLEIRSPFGCIA